MNNLAKYMKENNLDNETMAEIMKEKMGRNISAKGVEQMLKRKEAPIPWLNALGISPNEPSGLKDEPPPRIPGVNAPLGSQPSSGRTQIAEAINLPFEVSSARTTIELIYQMAGKGVAMGSRIPELEIAWSNAAPSIADAWIEWAKTNKTVANGIALLTVGGPGGQVILAHATLIITTLMTISQHRNPGVIPPPPFNIYEEMSEEDIRRATEQAVDDGLGNTPPTG